MRLARLTKKTREALGWGERGGSLLHIHGLTITVVQFFKISSRYLKFWYVQNYHEIYSCHHTQITIHFRKSQTTPELAIVTFLLTLPESDPKLSIFLTKSIPSITSPKRPSTIKKQRDAMRQYQRQRVFHQARKLQRL